MNVLRCFLGIAVALLTVSGARAETVYMMETCDPARLLVDCFEGTGALSQWIWRGGPNDRSQPPSASDRLVVEVGIGTFEGQLRCPGYAPPDPPNGYVFVVGAGRDRSILHWEGNPTGGALGLPGGGTVEGNRCEQFNFRDLRIENDGSFGIFWAGGGSSDWTDIDVQSGAAGWYDGVCFADPDDPPQGTHYWWHSNIVGGRGAFVAGCGASWLFDTTVKSAPVDGNPLANENRALDVFALADVRLFGSSVIVTSEGATTLPKPTAIGVRVGASGNTYPAGHGEFHMFGGEIVVDVSNIASENAVGLHVVGGAPDALARIMDVPFTLTAGPGGTTTRVTGTGRIESPVLWPSGDDPLVGVASQSGREMYVQTDCSATGCDGLGTEPHLMVREELCGSKWFDIVTGDCRP